MAIQTKRKYKRLKDDDVQKAILLRRQGYAISEIASVLDVCKTTIHKIMRVHGVHLYERLSDCEKDEIIKKRNEGKTFREIAYVLQRDQSTVSKIWRLFKKSE